MIKIYLKIFISFIYVIYLTYWLVVIIDSFINLFNHNENMAFGKKKQGNRTIDDVLEDLPVEKRKRIEKYIDDNVKKEYAPSNKDIVKEMGSCLKDFVNDKKYMEYGFVQFLSAAIYANIIPYAIATNVRIHEEKGRVFPYTKEKKLLDPKSYGQLFGGLIGGVTQGIAYLVMTLQFKHPEVFLIPGITNSVSGVYELRRAAKNKLIEKHKKDLENKID